jgi:hypothetical protein
MVLPTKLHYNSDQFDLRIRHASGSIVVDYYSIDGLILDYEKMLRIIEHGHADYDNEYDFEKINLYQNDKGDWKIEMPLSIEDQNGTIDLLIEFSDEGAWFDYVDNEGNTVSVADAMVLLTVI